MNPFNVIGLLFQQILMRPIFNGLMILYHLFGDFGLAIVVLTLIIKLLLFPLTLKQLRSMKATQQLQPHLLEIRRKHAKDQQAQLLAQQALYKEHGVSPFGGCLPSLAQLPILWALYGALNTVVSAENKKSLIDLNAWLYQPLVAPFTHLPKLDFTWFQWLSFLNPILHVHWSWTMSLVQPDPWPVLPIVAALATYLSVRVAQPKTAPVASKNGKAGEPDPQMQMQKTMQLMMPAMIFFFGLQFAAGLVLYWIVSSLFQALQQSFVTGRGSLLVLPKAQPSTNGSGSANSRIIDSHLVSDDGKAENIRSGSTSSQPKLNGNNNLSSRRQRGGSASARRRSQRSQR